MALPGSALFDRFSGHEQVVLCRDDRSGLRALVAVHSTARGPALGGTRFHPYASDADALRDVLNLSRGMSYKAAMAGLDLGGGKAVIIGDPRTDKTPALLRAYGRFVQSLGGPLLHRLRRGHLLRGHGRDRRGVPLRHRPHGGPGRGRRLLGADGVRRVPGHARRRAGDVGLAHARGDGRSGSPGSARWATTSWSTCSRTVRTWS